MKRSGWILAGAGAGLLAGTLAYAVAIEPRWLQTTRPRIHLRDLPAPLEGLRVALLTDLHAGSRRSLARVREAVRRTMAERPHIIALTGDFAADHEPDFARVLQALEGLRAPLGVYAVPGNHDHRIGIDLWRRQFAGAEGITPLVNAAVLRSVEGVRLCIAGVDDFYAGSPRLDFLPRPSGRDFTLLLAHGPDQAERLRRASDAVDLIVSGHTHGGQVQLPLLGAPLSSAENPNLYAAGLRRRPWTQVYTSRGVGTVHLPIRFLARPEVAVLRLTAAPRTSPGARWKRLGTGRRR